MLTEFETVVVNIICECGKSGRPMGTENCSFEMCCVMIAVVRTLCVQTIFLFPGSKTADEQKKSAGKVSKLHDLKQSNESIKEI